LYVKVHSSFEKVNSRRNFLDTDKYAAYHMQHIICSSPELLRIYTTCVGLTLFFDYGNVWIKRALIIVRFGLTVLS
jgi:hypothetical protein